MFRNQQAMLNDLSFKGVFILANNGAPDAKVGAGYAGKGSLCVDITTGIWYSNTGTATAPTWGKVGLQT